MPTIENPCTNCTKNKPHCEDNCKPRIKFVNQILAENGEDLGTIPDGARVAEISKRVQESEDQLSATAAGRHYDI